MDAGACRASMFADVGEGLRAHEPRRGLEPRRQVFYVDLDGARDRRRASEILEGAQQAGSLQDRGVEAA